MITLEEGKLIIDSKKSIIFEEDNKILERGKNYGIYFLN